MTVHFPMSDVIFPARDGDTMLLGSDRIFYSGRLRRSMKARNLGALSIYASAGSPFDISIGQGMRETSSLIAVPPYVAHRILPPKGPIWNLLIEPESTTDGAIASILALCNGPGRDHILKQLKRAETHLAQGPERHGFTTHAFDLLFFGFSLPDRTMDARITQVLRMLREEPNEANLSAENCAGAVGLSASRLSHLFRQETGVSFRSCKMWRRARRFLDQAAGDDSLTDVALGLGYPDSSHFSHSIRRTFGMQPGMIRAGSRNLRIWPGAEYRLFAANP